MLVLSFYQAYRAFMLQWILGVHRRTTAESGERLAYSWSACNIVLVLCLADALLFFVCTASGFVALHWALLIYTRIPSVQEISSGTSALLIFLGLVCVLGISGQLPPLLQQGKFPK